MPGGKPAATRCVQLDEEDRCKLFGQPARPAVCASLRPSDEMCGSTRAQALQWLEQMEQVTRPHIPIQV
jgi:hypothetical protein